MQYGDLHVLALYTGRVLYNNTLDLCTAEEGDDVQILRCPIARGNHYLMKEIKISNLLPKVRVQAWITGLLSIHVFHSILSQSEGRIQSYSHGDKPG